MIHVESDGRAEVLKNYLKDLMYFSKLPSSCALLLYELLNYGEYDKDGSVEVALNVSQKRRMQKALGFKNISSVNNAITLLVKNGYLKRIDTGIYLINKTRLNKEKIENLDKLTFKIKYSLDCNQKKENVAIY